ncbi:Acriflavine resistance protein B [Kluyvera cryocrescens]|uniref:Acriflavine resistance protein B n=1 Tax=Kluyvera cryocrescens TaxID=580 RepID=A0A485APF7_KLUCR|nr:Acriflavine resistance protein B [Kluyvera cryocrescens]
MAFVSLKNWSERKGAENTAQAIALRATKELGAIRDATLFAMTPPSVDGLGQSNGFTFELLASGGTDRAELLKMRDELIGKANQDATLHAVRANDMPQTPQLQVDIDNSKAVSLGLSLSDVTSTLSSAWGGTYVNDFIDRGRVKKVYIQGDSDSRSAPSDLGKWFVRGSDNSMTPFSAFATTRWEYGPESLVRYNGAAAYEIQGGKCHRRQLRHRDDHHGNPCQQSACRVNLGMERAVATGKTGQRSGDEPVRHLHSGGVPLPGGTV